MICSFLSRAPLLPHVFLTQSSMCFSTSVSQLFQLSILFFLFCRFHLRSLHICCTFYFVHCCGQEARFYCMHSYLNCFVRIWERERERERELLFLFNVLSDWKSLCFLILLFLRNWRFFPPSPCVPLFPCLFHHYLYYCSQVLILCVLSLLLHYVLYFFLILSLSSFPLYLSSYHFS